MTETWRPNPKHDENMNDDSWFSMIFPHVHDKNMNDKIMFESCNVIHKIVAAWRGHAPVTLSKLTCHVMIMQEKRVMVCHAVFRHDFVVNVCTSTQSWSDSIMKCHVWLYQYLIVKASYTYVSCFCHARLYQYPVMLGSCYDVSCMVVSVVPVPNHKSVMHLCIMLLSCMPYQYPVMLGSDHGVSWMVVPVPSHKTSRSCVSWLVMHALSYQYLYST